MKKRFAKISPATWVLLAALFLSACGMLVDMGNPDGGSAQRRVYVNDAAVADSLRSSLLTGGVSFVMQKGKKYSLRAEGAAAGDYLQVYSASGNRYFPWKNFSAGSEAGVFALQDSGSDAANYYLAFLRSVAGGLGTRPTKVRLVPAVPESASTMAVRLVMVGTLDHLGTQSLKESFAQDFLGKLSALYATYDITLTTSYEIVNPASGPFTVEFTQQTTFPGGMRAEKTVYMYLVNNITLDGKVPDDKILGFAPREAFDFASDQVVLSVETGASAVPIAVSAAHELGHFLGLRHTTSTDLDRRGDADLTNVEDGFDSTGYCNGLTKRAASIVTLDAIRTPDGRAYCLRTAVAHCSPSCADRTNLMFPYQCTLDEENHPIIQETMVREQNSFVRKNLKLFQQ